MSSKQNVFLGFEKKMLIGFKLTNLFEKFILKKINFLNLILTTVI